MTECKPCLTPIDAGRYQHLVGYLSYLSLTRLDITYVVGVISQHIHAPTQAHMEATNRMLRYLKGILYQKNGHHRVMAYTNADWAGSILDRRFTSGYCTFVGGNLVTW